MNVRNAQILAGTGAYLVSMILIGLFFARRRNREPEEYFLARRGFGPWVAALSAAAADMSGWLFMGLPGVAYFTGLGESFWTALGLFAGIWASWTVVARRLRVYSQIAGNAITLPEFFSKRFHDRKRILLIIAALISLVFFSIYIGAQFLAFGKFFGYIFHVKVGAMVVLGAALVMFHTLLGGFMGISIAGLIQGIFMIASLLLLLGTAFFHAGGVGGIAVSLMEIPRFTDFFGSATPVLVEKIQKTAYGVPLFGPGTNYGFPVIVSTLAWGLGYFGMPQVLVRYMAVRKTAVILPSRTIATLWYFFAQSAAVLVGIIGRAILMGDNLQPLSANDAENIFIILSTRFFPPVLAGLVLSGILAASMSSASSYMFIAASSLANDIYRGIFRKQASGAETMWVVRLTILAATAVGIIFALSGGQSIFRVVSFAWAGLGASFGPLILFSLFWKRTTLPSAVAGMLAGGVMAVLWKSLIARAGGVFAVYELLPAFLFSSLVIWLTSLLTPAPSRSIQAEFERVRNTRF